MQMRGFNNISIDIYLNSSRRYVPILKHKAALGNLFWLNGAEEIKRHIFITYITKIQSFLHRC